ncbi:MAG: hypothetical protein PHG45_05380 [Dehalococcoidales bacterium]|nr:hypothetical protein [Dehalococcoidales bacterium]
MPKLPKQLMDHRYECPWCGKSLPTPQGMSGHIQFAHATETLGDEPGTQKKDPIFEDRLAKRLESMLADKERTEFAEMDEAEINWEIAAKHLKLNGIATSNSDRKYFMLASMACIFSNMRLFERLRKEIRSLLA